MASGRQRSSPHRTRAWGKYCFKRAWRRLVRPGAFVDHGAAMKDRLLDRAGLAVFGRPGFEFVVVSQEQFGQVERVLGVVLGAAGDEGLADTSGG